MSKKVFIFAGEKSGDLCGRELMRSLYQKIPGVHIEGVGGQEMRTQGLDCIMRMEEFQIIGFTDVLLSLPKIRKQFYFIRDHILSSQPDVVVLIDYPGFNLRMARALRQQHFEGKIVQYVCPSVWAWGKSRIDSMAQTLDLLMTIYPFEAAHFAGTGLHVKYVGNPLREAIHKHDYRENWGPMFGLQEKTDIIAIFPGSRKGEIARILPHQLAAAEMLKQKNPDITFGLSCAHETIIPVLNKILLKSSLKLNQDIFLVPKAYSYELMRDCRTALAKSGSVTLELALHKRPTVVGYKISLLNRMIAKYVLRLNLPYYCIVNILANAGVFPELIESGFSSKNLFKAISQINADGPEREACIQGCNNLATLLKEDNASVRAAEAIKELIDE